MIHTIGSRKSNQMFANFDTDRTGVCSFDKHFLFFEQQALTFSELLIRSSIA